MAKPNIGRPQSRKQKPGTTPNAGQSRIGKKKPLSMSINPEKLRAAIKYLDSVMEDAEALKHAQEALAELGVGWPQSREGKPTDNSRIAANLRAARKLFVRDMGILGPLIPAQEQFPEPGIEEPQSREGEPINDSMIAAYLRVAIERMKSVRAEAEALMPADTTDAGAPVATSLAMHPKI